MTVDHAKWPNYREGDFVIRNYVFRSGERLPELNLHYRTLGTPRRNASRKTINSVLLLQGNTGTGTNWLRPSLAGPVAYSESSGRIWRSLRQDHAGTAPKPLEATKSDLGSLKGVGI